MCFVVSIKFVFDKQKTSVSSRRPTDIYVSFVVGSMQSNLSARMCRYVALCLKSDFK